jgi:hypothetical protein
MNGLMAEVREDHIPLAHWFKGKPKGRKGSWGTHWRRAQLSKMTDMKRRLSGSATTASLAADGLPTFPNDERHNR